MYFSETEDAQMSALPYVFVSSGASEADVC